MTMTKMLATALTIAALTGCGTAPSPLSATTNRVTAAGSQLVPGVDQGTVQTLTIENAIKAQLEKRIPDYYVTLSNMTVTPTIVPGLYHFTATETVTGWGEQQYAITGSYSTQTKKAVVQTTTKLAPAAK
jgi:hypothetical protein